MMRKRWTGMPTGRLFLYNALIGGLLLLGTSHMQAQGIQQKSRSVSKAFRVQAQTPVQLTGKYGKMEVRTWDKPEVSVEIEVTVSGRNMPDIEKMLARVDLSITGDAQGVFAAANIADSQQWNQNREALRIQFKDGTRLELTEIELHFQVYMPRTSPLKLENKFGDITLGAFSGNTHIWLKYGNLEAERLAGRNEMYLGYAKADIADWGTGILEASYSEVDIDKVKTLEIDSKNSEIYIGSADSITAGDKYNEYTLGKVGTFVLDEKHGKVEIQHINKGANVLMHYGTFSVSSLGRNFERVAFDGTHTDARIQVDPGAAYSLDAAATHCRIVYPQSLKMSAHVAKPDYEKVEGKVGGSSKSVIYVRSDYGKVRVE